MENLTNSSGQDDWLRASAKMSIAAYIGNESSTVTQSGRLRVPTILETAPTDDAMMRLTAEALEGEW